MKKISLIVFSSLLLLSPFFVLAAVPQGVVTCGADPSTPCQFSDLCLTAKNIMAIVINQVGSALAILLLTIGGLTLLFSGGNPNMKSLGKKILVTTIIGLALAFGAELIISFILTSLGSMYGIGC